MAINKDSVSYAGPNAASHKPVANWITTAGAVNSPLGRTTAPRGTVSPRMSFRVSAMAGKYGEPKVMKAFVKLRGLVVERDGLRASPELICQRPCSCGASTRNDHLDVLVTGERLADTLTEVPVTPKDRHRLS